MTDPQFSLIPKFLDEAATPVAREIGEGFADLVSLIFYPVKKAKARKEHELLIFMEELKNNVEKIPEDKLVEPPLHIVGPALEASKFYYQSNVLRSMFAKLIASSMNCDTVDYSRSTFVEIIKQLDPQDARILKELYFMKKCGVGQIRYGNIKESSILYNNFFPLFHLNKDNFLNIAVSINNIIRLGLIEVISTESYTNVDVYKALENHQLFEYFTSTYRIPGKHTEKNVFIKKMTWSFTQFGLHFTNCCLKEKQNITIETIET